MRKSMKVKTLAVILLVVTMFSATMVANAGTVSFGEKGIPYTSDIYEKTMSDGRSYLTLGYVGFYSFVKAQTYSETFNYDFIESCPLTDCYDYDTTYLGQYVNIPTWIGQGIYISFSRAYEMANNYTAEIDEWDYH